MAKSKVEAEEQLRKEVDEFDEAPEIGGAGDIWKPTDIGDRLIGEVIGKEDDRGGYGISLCIRAEEEIDGKLIWWTPAHKWLQNRLTGVKMGQRIGIEYQGLGEKKGRNPAPAMYMVKDLTKKA